MAGVAATSPHIADEALSLIEVDYEVLPPVVTVLEAMKEDAPLIHEDLTTMELGEDTDKNSNIASHMQHTLGDVEQAMAGAHLTAEFEVHTSSVHQGYIEPQNATAFWNQDGMLTIWTSTQGAFTAQRQLGAILGVPVARIKVVPQEIGGGFGGKIPVYLEPVASLLSRQTGHPVKLIMSRADVFEATGPTPGSYIRVTMGVDSSGKLVAADAYIAGYARFGDWRARFEQADELP